MKLVIATPLYPPDIGGPATYARLLFDGLPKKGIEVELVKFSEVRHLPKLIRHYAYYRRVLKAARNADAVLALDPVSVGLPALKAAQRAGKPFVVKIVGDYAWEQGTQRCGVTQNLDEFVKTKKVPFMVKLLRKIQTCVARSATHVIVPSQYLKSIVEAWDIPREKIHVIYNAVALEKLGTTPYDVGCLPRAMVASVGRLVPWKGIEGVIDAVAMLRKKGMVTSLVVVGDGPERISLIKQAEQKLQAGYFFTGLLSHADTLSVIQGADVLVLNSSYEGLSHVLIETLMLGIPVVATRVGGNTEVITDGEEGFLIPSGDVLAMVEALTRILPNNTLWPQLSMRAKESAKRFSVEMMLSQTATLLQTV